MQEIVRRKLGEFARAWLHEKGKHLFVQDEQSRDIMETLEVELTNPSPDFHDYLFLHLEEYADSFNKYTRMYIFTLAFAALEHFALEGLISWETFRAVLTPKGETYFSAEANKG